MLSSTQQQQGGQSLVTRILLVDDDPHLVPLIQRGLAYEGFEVYTAMDGEAGLALAPNHLFCAWEPAAHPDSRGDRSPGTGRAGDLVAGTPGDARSAKPLLALSPPDAFLQTPLRRSPSEGSAFYKHLGASLRAPGLTRTEPSGKTMVGTLRMPRLMHSTSEAARASVSILI